MTLSFLYNRKNLFIIGFIIAFFVTFIEFTRGRDMNFMVFADATLDFWQGTSPYTDLFVTQHGRFFLYSPIFTVLFAPFAFLPSWLGPFAWNLFNYTLFYVAIFSLPERFSNREKCNTFLFLFPILGQSLFSFQYNIPVTYLFLFAYTLLEKKRGLWAVLLIMISGCTKIYGIFELALLVCYPRFWRNAGFALLLGGVLLSLPLLKLAPAEFLPYYGEWFHSLSNHQSHTTYESLFHIRFLSEWLLPHFRILQMGIIGVLALLLFSNRKKWSSTTFRAQALGILMGMVVLFSDSAESHTYLIALAGFMLWYWSRHQHSAVDKTLLWACFTLLCIVPIDIFVPTPVMRLLTQTLQLQIWVFLFTWLRMVGLTFLRPLEEAQEPEHHTRKSVLQHEIHTLDIICPCYNPSAHFIADLAKPLNELRAFYPDKRLHLIVVNDGSDRNFGEKEHVALLQEISDIEIVDIPHAGKGAAVRAGIARSKAPYAIYTDIDIPYTLETMCEVIDRMLAGSDVVIAVRNKSYHCKLSPLRKLLSWGSKILNRIFLNTCHTDTQGGLKGISLRAGQITLRTRINDYLFDTEFIVLASRDKNIQIDEIESTLRDGIVMSKMSTRVMLRELKNFIHIAVRV